MRQQRFSPSSINYLAFLFLIILAACAPAAPAPTQPEVNQKPAEFEVGPIAFEPPIVMVGDSVTVSASVSNIGGAAGSYTATLSIDGQTLDTKTVSVEPGSSREAVFQVANATAGSHEILIGNCSTTLIVYNWSPAAIRYDQSDWGQAGIYISGDNGHLVRFTPPNKAFKIQKIRTAASVNILNNSDYQNHVTVRIWDKDGNNQLWSQDFTWLSFHGWSDIEVPNVRVNDDFEVEVVTHSVPSEYIPGTSIPSPGGDPIDFFTFSSSKGRLGPQRIVALLFDYPQSYLSQPGNRPETRSGYSYMGKLIDPGQKRLEGIRWLIRVEGEGAAGSE